MTGMTQMTLPEYLRARLTEERAEILDVWRVRPEAGLDEIQLMGDIVTVPEPRHRHPVAGLLRSRNSIC
jgi:hypothetical protein